MYTLLLTIQHNTAVRVISKNSPLTHRTLQNEKNPSFFLCVWCVCAAGGGGGEDFGVRAAGVDSRGKRLGSRGGQQGKSKYSRGCVKI